MWLCVVTGGVETGSTTILRCLQVGFVPARHGCHTLAVTCQVCSLHYNHTSHSLYFSLSPLLLPVTYWQWWWWREMPVHWFRGHVSSWETFSCSWTVNCLHTTIYPSFYFLPPSSITIYSPPCLLFICRFLLLLPFSLSFPPPVMVYDGADVLDYVAYVRASLPEIAGHGL